jgi:hypothetical protein
LSTAQLEFHLWVHLLERGQHRHHVDVGQRGNLPDGQQPRTSPLTAATSARRWRRLASTWRACTSNASPAAVARTWRGRRSNSVAQFLLQVGDLVAERGLHHVAAFGGTGEIALLGQGNGKLELLEVHPTILFSDGKDDDDSFPS